MTTFSKVYKKHWLKAVTGHSSLKFLLNFFLHKRQIATGDTILETFLSETSQYTERANKRRTLKY